MQSTAASRALLCQEIVVEIFDYLSPGRQDDSALPREKLHRREAQKALARAARVCHAFSGPALNVLWRVTDSLTSLLSVLPSFTMLPSNQYALSRDATDAEWARFQEYAKRVRELYTRSDFQISPSVWIFFARRCPDGHGLIPRLQRLDALDVSSTEPGKILLLSPTLRHLSLTIQSTSHRIAEHSPIVNTVMELVQKISIPHLEALRITSSAPFDPETTPYVSLAHLQELEILAECFLDKDRLQELLTFPHLRKLTVKPTFLGDIIADQLTPGFQSLLDLKVIGYPATVAKFLQLTAPPALESLAIEYTTWITEPAQPGVSDTGALGSVAALKSLRRLDITFSSYLLPASLLTVLEPALALDGLTRVAVTIAHLEMELPVTDAELRTMAGAWPRLREFEINVQETDGHEEVLDYDGRPSAQALVLFAERHPHLVRLVWPCVEMANPAAPLDLQSVPRLDHGLQVFRSCIVENDGLPKQREFAMLIDRLFPNLDLSDVQYPAVAKSSYGRQRYRNWCDVEQFLLAIQAGRRTVHRD